MAAITSRSHLGVPLLLRPVQPHGKFQEQLRTELRKRYPDPAKSLQTWAEELRTVWCANLDFADPVLRSTYSAVGRPVEYDPKALLRCLLLCQQRGFRGLTQWALQLEREPVLPLLCGFPAGISPSVGTVYGFLRRVFPEPPAFLHVKGIVRQHRRVKKPGNGQKLPPDRKKLARLARWLLGHLRQTPAPTPADLWDLVLAGAVGESVHRGILPANASLRAATDGSLLRCGAHSHGHKVCHCRDRRCTCPRYFSDPTARAGYDSTNNCFVLGRSAYVISETDSGHHLPLTLTTGPANRADSVSLMLSMRKAHRLLPRLGVTLTTAFGDSAHDHDPCYTFTIALGAEPVFDRHGKLPAKVAPVVAERLAAAGLSLSLEGRPRCEHGFLHSAGHCRPGVRQFQCPKTDPAACPCTSCPLRNGGRWTIDVRFQPRLLARNPQVEPATKREYKRRTNVERTFSLLTSSSALDTARHRRDYVWHGRLAVTAVLIHARVWSRIAEVSAKEWLRAWAVPA